MKFSAVTIALLFLMQATFAQKPGMPTNGIPQHNFDYYMKKRNGYNTAGWLCFGSGALLTGAAGIGIFAGAVDNTLNRAHHNLNGAVTVACVGEAAMFISIPLFVIAHINKRKAHFSLQRERITINNKLIYQRNYNAIAFTVPF